MVQNNSSIETMQLKRPHLLLKDSISAVLRFSRCPLLPFGREHRSERVRDMLRRHYHFSFSFLLPTLSFLVARIPFLNRLTPGSLVLLFYLFLLPGFLFLTDFRRDHWSYFYFFFSIGSLVLFDLLSTFVLIRFSRYLWFTFSL